MPALYLVIPRASGGGQISAADINQLVNTLTGNQNTSVSIKNTDPIAYTLQLQNTDPAGKTLLIYGPDGTTVILRSQGNGVVASPDGSAAAPVVTTTHAQTLSSKTLTAPVITSLQVQSGNVGIAIAPPAARSLEIASTDLVSANQAGIYVHPTASSAATGSIIGVQSSVGTTAAAFTMANAYAFYATAVQKGAGSTITSAYGLFIEAIQQGNANNYGVYINAPSGGTGANVGLVVAGGGITFAGTAPQIGGMFGMGSTTTTTVGAAGGAAALPATPVAYLVCWLPGTGTCRIPLYL